MEGRRPLPIENCRRFFKFLCPKRWSQLDRTPLIDVRFCQGCRKNVYYCETVEAIEGHRAAGDCICVEDGVELDDEESQYLG